MTENAAPAVVLFVEGTTEKCVAASVATNVMLMPVAPYVRIGTRLSTLLIVLTDANVPDSLV